MATQIEPTPVLYGEDAKAILRQLRQKRSEEQKQKARRRKEFFASIHKKGGLE